MENENKEIKTKKQILLDIIGWIPVLLLIFLAIGAVLGIYKHKTTGEEVSIYGYKPVWVMTGSMEPTLKTNALAIVKKTSDINQGDILMFKTKGGYVIHRFHDINEGMIITKGDNNEDPDFELLDQKNIYGKVVFKVNWIAPIIRKITGNTGVG